MAGLPVGFTVAHGSGGPVMGMTCAACHTRQIEVAGSSYRIDGGPAIVDFQSFLADLDASVAAVLKTPEAFSGFAEAVPGPIAAARREGAVAEGPRGLAPALPHAHGGALPAQPWGPARLDAVSMIFNRLTGLDLGPPSNSYIIKENIRVADAPVRTIRSSGTPRPRTRPSGPDSPTTATTSWACPATWARSAACSACSIPGRRRGGTSGSSTSTTTRPTSPAWRRWKTWSGSWARRNGRGPWTSTLPSRAGPSLERPKAQGGCTECHGIRTGKIRSLIQKTWATPIQDVGTDSRQYDILKRDAQTGALNGAKIPFVTQELKNVDTAFNVLRTAVVGAIVQYKLPVVSPEIQGSSAAALKSPLTPETEALKGAFNARSRCAGLPAEASPTSRVLEGIWATAPYLHNGSVPTLAKLLAPAKDRPERVRDRPGLRPREGRARDGPDEVHYKLKTTDCTDRNSGNSRCGHEWGTELSEGDKKALLEYLKVL